VYTAHGEKHAELTRNPVIRVPPYRISCPRRPTHHSHWNTQTLTGHDDEHVHEPVDSSRDTRPEGSDRRYSGGTRRGDAVLTRFSTEGPEHHANQRALFSSKI